MSGRTLSLRPRAAPGSSLEVGRALQLRTARISRGQHRLSLDGTAAPTSDGALELVSGEVTERYRNTEKGVEQSWRFEQAPGTRGDLVVRVGVRGEQWRARSQRGLHFVDPDTGLGFRYGWATWIDAGGHRTAIRGSWHGGAIELRVPAGIVSSSSYPALLDPLVSPEFGINTPALATPTTSQARPAVASDGTDWLVVWQEVLSTDLDIVGTRVAADGTQLSPPVTLIAAPGTQAAPSVDFDGTNYVLTWGDLRTQASTGSDVYAARVTTSGSVLDPGGFPVTTATGDQKNPDIACAAGSCLVAWQSAGAIRGARIAGSSTGSALTISSSSAMGALYPDIAFDGTNYLVAWRDTRNSATTGADLYGTRVSEAGALVDSADTPLATEPGDERGPALVFDGTDYFLASMVQGSSQSVVNGTRFKTDLTKLDSSPIVISGSTSPTGKFAAGFDGTDYAVVWSDGTDLWTARVGTDGTLVDTAPIHVGLGTAPEAAGNGTSSMIVWRYAASTGSEVLASRLLGDGSVDPSLGSLKYAQAEQPRVAFDGTNWLAVWSEEGHIRGTRIDASATILDPSGIDIGDGRLPDVASNGSSYLVTWQGAGGSALAARVSTQGALLDTPVTLDPALDVHIRVASNGSNYLVVFRHGAPYPPLAAWVAVDASGAPSSVHTRADSLMQYDPAVASDGTGFLLAWTTDAALVLNRTDAAGTIVRGTTLPGLSTPRSTAVASDGADFLVAWSETGGAATRVRAAFATADGSSLGAAFSLCQATGGQASPELTFDGGRYLAVWADARNAGSDLYGTYVTPAGVDPADGFVIAQDLGVPGSPDVAADGTGHALLVYPEYDATLATQRIYGRTITSLPLGASCSSGDECSSGECVNSKCDCTAQSCPVACQSAADCAADEYCWISVCEPKRGTGAFCTDASQCGNGFCADGVCCDSACTGQCEACNEPGSAGTCTAVKGAPRGSRNQCGSGPCGGSCDGVDRASCSFPGAGVQCKAASCVGSTYTPASYCNGSGQCDAAAPEACSAPYKCVYNPAATCSDVCNTAADCILGDECVDGRCQGAHRADGMPCSADTNCGSGHCADGVCCDSACTGQCEACDLSSSMGSCSAVTGAPHGSRSACQSRGACSAACDGGNRQACAYLHVQCAPASCSGGVESTSYCVSTGACIAEQLDCGDYACGPYLCRTSCATDADCATGRTCIGGACIASDAGAGGQGGSAGAAGAAGSAGNAGSAGQAGSGGLAGAAGSAAGGGAAGAGATAGPGGAAGSAVGGGAGSGGSPTGGSAGQSGDAGIDASSATPTSQDSGGCGCQAPARPPAAPWAALTLLVWGVRRRRGARRSKSGGQ